MATNLRQWLQGIEYRFAKHKPHARTKEIALPDMNELVFTLATSNEISETLPAVLRPIQQTMDNSFAQRERGDLLVLFSHLPTSESYLYHARENKPAAGFIQELHRTFTLSQTPKQTQINFTVNNTDWKIAPRRLLESANLNIWLIFAFEDMTPPLEKLKWRTAGLETALTKGLQAWHQREEKIKAALQTERAVYAAELHDSLAQVLGYLRIKSARLDKLCLQQEYQALKPMTEELAAQTHCAYRQTRELITSSRLTMQTENLSESVTSSIREFEQQSAIVFELDNRMQLNVLSTKQSMQILYIIRESLSNIVRHSHASHARVVLSLSANRHLHITIEDNGIGIESNKARNDSFGLQIMYERAERIGARLTISDRPNGGTRTQLTLDAKDSHD